MLDTLLIRSFRNRTRREYIREGNFLQNKIHRTDFTRYRLYSCRFIFFEENSIKKESRYCSACRTFIRYSCEPDV